VWISSWIPFSRPIFGSLKHDWILKVAQPTREHMKLDVARTATDVTAAARHWF
jgi:hypothetical protein